MTQQQGRHDAGPSTSGPVELIVGSRRFSAQRPAVMAVLNVTPDSFSDGGRHTLLSDALAAADRMLEEGADIIDVGGESTRPGSEPVPIDEELRRVIPLIQALKRDRDCLVSIDTRHAQVMEAACEAGADLINDVQALEEPRAIQIAARFDVAVCLMHMKGEPSTMQQSPGYADVIAEVSTYLQSRIDDCKAGGIAEDRIAVDPGIGFGKRLEDNLRLIAHIPDLLALGRPLLIGVSRKSMFGQLLGAPVDRRLAASLSAASVAVWLGATVIRAHDIGATVDAVRTAAALRSAAALN